jgi:hypothetical protein
MYNSREKVSGKDMSACANKRSWLFVVEEGGRCGGEGVLYAAVFL